MARYGPFWVQYIQDGDAKVLPVEDLDDEDMLVMRPVVWADMTRMEKAYLYLYLALVLAVLEKDMERFARGG